MGADYLEQDVVATSDDKLVVLHDIHLDRISNVRKQFPKRCRHDGRYYARDFSLREIKTLRVHERENSEGRVVYADRYQSGEQTFQVQTFAEEIQFILDMQASIGRTVGIYPEIKRPEWHRNEGVDITQLFLQELGEFGYSKRDDPVYVQCFHAAELVRIREVFGSDLKLIQLIGENVWAESSTNYDAMRSARGLRRAARIVDGIAPWINRLYHLRRSDGQIRDSGLVSRAHDAGLAVHPYTLRKDDLPPGFQTVAELLRFLSEKLCVDGVFTDFPDLVRRTCTNAQCS